MKKKNNKEKPSKAEKKLQMQEAFYGAMMKILQTMFPDMVPSVPTEKKSDSEVNDNVS